MRCLTDYHLTRRQLASWARINYILCSLFSQCACSNLFRRNELYTWEMGRFRAKTVQFKKKEVKNVFFVAIWFSKTTPGDL